MKFDVCLMNPPYGDANNGGMFLDQQFVKRSLSFSKICVAVFPNRFASKTNIGEFLMSNRRLRSIDFYDAYDMFKINTRWKWVGVYTYMEYPEYEKIQCTNVKGDIENVDRDFNSRSNYIKSFRFSKDAIQLIDKLYPLYKNLMMEYHTMVNDTEDYIYEENELSRGKKLANVTKSNNVKLNRVKDYLKSGKYKYCLYTGSYNNEYKKFQEWRGEDPDKLFGGQICWLTNKQNVKDNIKYWLEYPICDFWRKFYFVDTSAKGCRYGLIPALDFNQDTELFKEYVNDLYKFNDDEIKILKENNIHNVDLL